MADHLRTELVADALSNAVAARVPDPGVVFHSDRGCQYTSAAFAAVATDSAVRLSVGRTGQCWDNALAESFFASLKGECLDHQPWPTRTSARHAIVDYIACYNGTRLPSALGYQTPNEYETTGQANQQVARPRHQPCPSKRDNLTVVSQTDPQTPITAGTFWWTTLDCSLVTGRRRAVVDDPG